ncbi:hypothetical protein B4N89_32480 [Embleya scabrispora]|uniref:Uncharacterized protein n=1 Tax=Embleya scabrispora TaxID=159449 RepID=A0A1T3NQG0_9ACTN|nr:hypothetical protein [Embleya scabrispora]OPC78851.1 hypothetical protein B4N89_32480 [Embleya scabrispora]
MPVFAGGPDPRDRPRHPRLRPPFRPRAAGVAGVAEVTPDSPSRPTAASRRAGSAPGTVLAFLGLLLVLFAVAFTIGRQAGPVAPDLRKPGPPGAPVKMGDEGGGHGRMGLGGPDARPRAFGAAL